mmetsp:Transcript_6081/g.7940  ORF Transcript_6081/g.7940 Transcript_6081/m.7940 type:complete len:87 (+) Transcript_6081:766-1026(+)
MKSVSILLNMNLALFMLLNSQIIDSADATRRLKSAKGTKAPTVASTGSTKGSKAPKGTDAPIMFTTGAPTVASTKAKSAKAPKAKR